MWLANLKDLNLQVLEHEPLARHVSLKVGGKARAVILVEELPQLVELVNRLEVWGVSYYVLGRGTNVLVADQGYPGAVIKLTGDFSRLEAVEGGLVVGAAVPLPKLALTAYRWGYKGLEWAAGIPGSLGGAVRGNAGAHGGSMQDVVATVEVFHPLEGVTTYDREDLDFSYRQLKLPKDGIVLSSRLSLSTGASAETWARMEQYKAERLRNQPLKLPNAGSVFRNPPGDYAGRLIEAVGLKGLRIGDAAVSEQHANFIVNLGQATAADIVRLLLLIRQRVLAETGVALRLEWKLLGFSPDEERALETVA
ncbi:MAG TPA: UDP-N-acetylmuramate dehydrogenase [Firmicutes bacterium]|nr:UDP-N-acetylmuramate dehydrogenase [Bacillota bacterium]